MKLDTEQFKKAIEKLKSAKIEKFAPYFIAYCEKCGIVHRADEKTIKQGHFKNLLNKLKQ